VDPFIKRLAEPLKHSVQTFREAVLFCEKSEGFAALCSRASQRLFYGGYLLPEFEGVVRSAEPDPIQQVQDDLRSLLATAAEAQRILRERIDHRPWDKGMRIKPKAVPVALFAYDPGIKTVRASKAKAAVLHGPTEGPKRYRNLLDLARITLVFPTCDMLQAGLELMVRVFDEVVAVINRFATPARIGARWIEVLVVVQVPCGNGRMVPHICEIRLEQCDLWDVQKSWKEELSDFDEMLADKYSRASRDIACITYLGRKMLMEPANDHALRILRSKMAKRFGSTCCAWRKVLGTGGRITNFKCFREFCHGLKCGEQATRLWLDMDNGMGGNISLYDLDPEAAALLTRIRSRIMALLHGTQADAPYTDDKDGEILFARVCVIITPHKPGFLDIHEFRTIMRSLGFNTEDSDKAFTLLDHEGGSDKKPPALISKADICWLRRITTLIDVEALSLSAADKPMEEDYLRVLCSGLLTPRRTLASQQAERWAYSIAKRSEDKPKKVAGLGAALQTSSSAPITPRTDCPADDIPEASDSDLEKAALKIQATFRGKNTRRKVDEMKEDSSERDSPVEMKRVSRQHGSPVEEGSLPMPEQPVPELPAYRLSQRRSRLPSQLQQQRASQRATQLQSEDHSLTSADKQDNTWTAEDMNAGTGQGSAEIQGPQAGAREPVAVSPRAFANEGQPAHQEESGAEQPSTEKRESTTLAVQPEASNGNWEEVFDGEETF